MIIDICLLHGISYWARWTVNVRWKYFSDFIVWGSPFPIQQKYHRNQHVKHHQRRSHFCHQKFREKELIKSIFSHAPGILALFFVFFPRFFQTEMGGVGKAKFSPSYHAGSWRMHFVGGALGKKNIPLTNMLLSGWIHLALDWWINDQSSTGSNWIFRRRSFLQADSVIGGGCLLEFPPFPPREGWWFRMVPKGCI